MFQEHIYEKRHGCLITEKLRKGVMVGESDREVMKRDKLTILSAIVTLFLFVGFASSGAAGFNAHNMMVMVDGEDESHSLKGKGAFLGIYMDELTLRMKKDKDYPEDSGVLVTKVIDDSPADEAGLEDGDIIFSFDGKKVEDPAELASLVSKRKPGDKVKIVFYRDGKKINTEVELGERPWNVSELDWDDIGKCARDIAIRAGNLGRYASRYLKDVFIFRGKLGMEVHDLNSDLAKALGLKKPRGVLVLDVDDDSPVYEAGVRAGDVVVGVNGEEVEDVDDLVDIIGDMDFEKGDVVKLKVVRRGREKTISLKITEENYEEFMFEVGPFGKSIKINIEEPPVRVKKHKVIRIERERLEKELKELKRHVKRLEEKLKELEKDRD